MLTACSLSGISPGPHTTSSGGAATRHFHSLTWPWQGRGKLSCRVLQNATIITMKVDAHRHYYENRCPPSFRRRPESRGGAWTPAFAGVTVRRPYHFHPRMWPAGAWAITMKIASARSRTHRHSGAGRNPGVGRWTPAFAGVTVGRPYHFHPCICPAGA